MAILESILAGKEKMKEKKEKRGRSGEKVVQGRQHTPVTRTKCSNRLFPLITVWTSSQGTFKNKEGLTVIVSRTHRTLGTDNLHHSHVHSTIKSIRLFCISKAWGRRNEGRKRRKVAEWGGKNVT